jgi:hypothetical protein
MSRPPAPWPSEVGGTVSSSRSWPIARERPGTRSPGGSASFPASSSCCRRNFLSRGLGGKKRTVRRNYHNAGRPAARRSTSGEPDMARHLAKEPSEGLHLHTLRPPKDVLPVKLLGHDLSPSCPSSSCLDCRRVPLYCCPRPAAYGLLPHQPFMAGIRHGQFASHQLAVTDILDVMTPAARRGGRRGGGGRRRG